MSIVGKSSYNIVALDTICLSPSTHNPRIVEGYDCYNIDSLSLELLDVLNIAWKMPDRTTWCERSGYCKQDNLLVCPFFRGIVIGWNLSTQET